MGRKTPLSLNNDGLMVIMMAHTLFFAVLTIYGCEEHKLQLHNECFVNYLRTWSANVTITVRTCYRDCHFNDLCTIKHTGLRYSGYRIINGLEAHRAPL